MPHDIALFVYGSLKRGFRHEDMLRGALRVGPAAAAPYLLVEYRGYPAMVPAEDGVVQGELVSVDRDMLLVLDEFEGCPTLYQRATILLIGGREAEAYLISSELARGHTPIAGGIWSEE